MVAVRLPLQAPMTRRQAVAGSRGSRSTAGRSQSACIFLATAWGPSAFQQFGARFKDDRAWQFVSIACGHDVMVDRLQELIAALIAAA
jgi:hypothetical protein